MTHLPLILTQVREALTLETKILYQKALLLLRPISQGLVLNLVNQLISFKKSGGQTVQRSSTFKVSHLECLKEVHFKCIDGTISSRPARV